MASKKRDNWSDLLLLSLFPLLAVSISFLFTLNFFLSTIFFFCMPAIYLSFKTKWAILRALLFALPFGFFGSIFIDYIAGLDKSWYVPTIFPTRIFGVIPLEDLFWGLSITYFIVIFYEHFLDKQTHKIIDKKMKYFIYTALVLCMLFLFFLVTNTHLLYIPYWYVKVGILFILIPMLLFTLSFPRYIKKFIKTAPYFFFVGILQEVTALRLGYWNFPGKHYIGWVHLLGFRFPFEELFFWLMIFSTCVLSYFEFFDDNHLQLKYSEENKLLQMFKKRKK